MNIDNNSDVNTELSDGRTVVSRYTNCTNPTFNPVNHIWKNGNQDDVIHLLAFAADTIREREGDQSDVEYYGVLLGALDGIPVEDVKKVYANSYLLHLLFPKVPKELLIKHFDKAKGVCFEYILFNLMKYIFRFWIENFKFYQLSKMLMVL